MHALGLLENGENAGRQGQDVEKRKLSTAT